MANMIGSICLSDIDKSLITTASNGKKYLNVFVGEKKTIGKYGETHFIKMSVKKGGEKEGVNYFIGNLKPIGMPAESERVITSDDDIPF